MDKNIPNKMSVNFMAIEFARAGTFPFLKNIYASPTSTTELLASAHPMSSPTQHSKHHSCQPAEPPDIYSLK